MSRRWTDDEHEALRAFATLGVSVSEFLRRMQSKIKIGEFRPGFREIAVGPLPDPSVIITRDDICRVVQRYIQSEVSGEELSNWAGLILAIGVYELPAKESDDDMLRLLNDLALPLAHEHFDREALTRRLQ